MEENPWVILGKKSIYSNNWIEVIHHDVLTPSKTKGIYGKIHFKNLALGVIPLDEQLNTWIVGQYRFPLNRYSWEIPEGGGAMDVEPIESAKRELKEEVGITANKWTHLLNMHLSNSVSDEYGLIYIAQDLKFGSAEPDENEQLQIRKVPFMDVFEMVMNGEITDSMSVAAILKLKILLDRNEI